MRRRILWLMIPLPADTSGDPDQVIVAALVAVLMALLGVVVFLAKTYNQAKQANAAVNNVGPGDHSLWDAVNLIRSDVEELVKTQRDFNSKGWATLPSDIGTASELTATIRELQLEHRHHNKKLTEIEQTLKAHDAWERTQKHAQPGGDE